MKGDFTRDTYNPLKHFSRVLMQQGRVQLDADWNEQGAILLHYLRALAADLIGPFGGTEHAFEIFNVITQKKPANAGELQLTADETKRLTDAGVLDDKGNVHDGDFLIGTGHYYVDGLLCENEDYVRYLGQGEWPGTEPLRVDSFLAYLDVWERHITYLEDESFRDLAGESFPGIREVALGGPDTATRAKLVWQVKTWTPPPGSSNKTTMKSAVIKDNWPDWVKRFEPENRGMLRAKVTKPDGPDAGNACLTSPDARYRGADNQLYRVEIHQGGNGKAGVATFKWSRENGSVVFPILQLSSDSIKLAHLGRDSRLGLKVGDWVEITNDEMILQGDVPPLVQVDSIEPIDMVLRIKVPAGLKTLPFKKKEDKTLLLRRWDHKADIKKGGAVALVEDGGNKNWLMLEDGVQIQFQAGADYRAGDYWLIPARTATGDIEWPKDKDGNPLSQAPHGVPHHYAPLAVVSIVGGSPKIDDCRTQIKQLI
jgi:Family of unknown function (DUF6519)